MTQTKINIKIKIKMSEEDLYGYLDIQLKCVKNALTKRKRDILLKIVL